jgi:hypothetical protein
LRRHSDLTAVTRRETSDIGTSLTPLLSQ